MTSSTAPSRKFNHDIRGVICEFLKDDEISTLSKCCLDWLKSTIEFYKDQLKNYVAQEGFGADKWKRYFGVVDPIPFPVNLWKELNSQCPFWPNKKVKDTHRLLLLPKAVNSNPMTLNMLELLGEKYKRSITYQKGILSDKTAKETYGNEKYKRSCWILITKENIPNSWFYPKYPYLSVAYDEKEKLLSKRIGYHHPKILEAVFSLLINNGWQDNSTTVCQEKELPQPLFCGGSRHFVGLTNMKISCKDPLIKCHSMGSVCIGSQYPSLPYINNTVYGLGVRPIKEICSEKEGFHCAIC